MSYGFFFFTAREAIRFDMPDDPCRALIATAAFLVLIACGLALHIVSGMGDDA